MHANSGLYKLAQAYTSLGDIYRLAQVYAGVESIYMQASRFKKLSSTNSSVARYSTRAPIGYTEPLYYNRPRTSLWGRVMRRYWDIGVIQQCVKFTVPSPSAFAGISNLQPWHTLLSNADHQQKPTPIELNNSTINQVLSEIVRLYYLHPVAINHLVTKHDAAVVAFENSKRMRLLLPSSIWAGRWFSSGMFAAGYHARDRGVDSTT